MSSSDGEVSATVSVGCRLENELKSVERPISPTLRSARCLAEAAPALELCRMASSRSTVAAVLWGPAAAHSTAMHCAMLTCADFPVSLESPVVHLATLSKRYINTSL